MHVYQPSPSRVVVELPEEATPPGLALELDVATFTAADGRSITVAERLADTMFYAAPL